MEGNDNLQDMSLFNNIDLELNFEGSLPDEDIMRDFLEEDGAGDSAGDANAGDDDDNLEGDNDNNLGEDDESDENEDEESRGSSQEEGSDTGDSQDASPNFYSSLATVLNEQGLLPNLNLKENKIENIDDFTNAIKSEVNDQVKNYLLEKIGEEGYDALEKGISLAEFEQHRNNVLTLDSIDEQSLSDNLELSKEIILQDYIQQGISEDKAIRILKKTIDLGDEAILEDAKLSLQSLKEFEQVRLENVKVEREKARLDAIREQEKIDNDLKNSIYKSDEIIPGMKLNKQIQDKVYKSITEIVGQTPDGMLENKLMKHRREDPIAFDVKMYYLYELTNGFNDFSAVVKKQQSRAVNDLERALRQTSFEDSGNPTYLDDRDSYEGGLGSELVM